MTVYTTGNLKKQTSKVYSMLYTNSLIKTTLFLDRNESDLNFL